LEAGNVIQGGAAGKEKSLAGADASGISVTADDTEVVPP
jgi:hypothetical protein